MTAEGARQSDTKNDGERERSGEMGKIPPKTRVTHTNVYTFHSCLDVAAAAVDPGRSNADMHQANR